MPNASCWLSLSWEEVGVELAIRDVNQEMAGEFFIMVCIDRRL